jgi:hypothetical protein
MVNTMTLKYKPDFKRAQKYWDAFWAHAIIDRPAILVNVVKKHPENFLKIRPVMGNFKEAFEEFDNKLFSNITYLGEAMPKFVPGFGPDQMAGFCGAPLVMSPDSHNTSWSQKIVENWPDALPIKITEDNITWQRMIEFHKASQEYVKGKCLLANIDMHSNIDLLEGLRGAQKLLFDMIDNPEIILRALADARKLYSTVYNEFWKYGDKENLGSTSWLTHLYSRRKFNPIQADFIALLNPAMFRQFVLPALEEEAAFLDDSVFHLDGPGALIHLDDILTIKGIETIQWGPGVGQKPQIEWMEVLQKIVAAKKAAIIYATPEQIKTIHKQFPPNLIIYDTEVKTEQEGLELLDWLVKNT